MDTKLNDRENATKYILDIIGATPEQYKKLKANSYREIAALFFLYFQNMPFELQNEVLVNLTDEHLKIDFTA